LPSSTSAALLDILKTPEAVCCCLRWRYLMEKFSNFFQKKAALDPKYCRNRRCLLQLFPGGQEGYRRPSDNPKLELHIMNYLVTPQRCFKSSRSARRLRDFQCRLSHILILVMGPGEPRICGKLAPGAQNPATTAVPRFPRQIPTPRKTIRHPRGYV
jgi:hypothetical protein